MPPLLFKIHACHNDPITDAWREQLIAMLGSKPRRLSRWCELGLWGVLSCIHKSHYSSLPAEVAIRIISEYSTLAATRSAITQTKDFLPMPFTFMQTQPGQLLNALGSALAWHGDGYNSAYKDRQKGEIALLHGIRKFALIGYVDEALISISRWILLEKMAASHDNEAPLSSDAWQPVNSLFEVSDTAIWMRLEVHQGFFQVI